MNPKLRKYAWVGLAVAATSALFSIVYYFIFRKFDLGVQIGIGLVIIGLALFALMDPQKLREVLTGRQMKYGSNTAVFLIAILGILIVVNILANKYDQKWDFTEDKVNTLSQETIQVVEALPSSVEVTGFFSKNLSTETAKILLDNLKLNSNGKLDYRFVDPDNDPVTTQRYGINSDGTLVFEMNGHQQMVKVISEEEVATALVKLSNPDSSVVYFLTGHGEHDPTVTTDDGFSAAAGVLARKNYTIKSLNLLVNSTIPEDADAIIVAGPQNPLATDEVRKLKEFVNKGKSLIVMEDSPVTNNIGDSNDPLVDYLLSDWGIALGKDFVLDMGSNSPAQSIASQYGNHPIVNRLAGIVTIFPSARSVTSKDPAPENITLTNLVMTSTNSWSETDLTGLKNNQYTYDEGLDIKGPVSLAVAGTNTQTGSRVVVVGSSFFAVDKNFNVYGNGDFLVNIIDWSTENENLINLTPKQRTDRIIASPSNLSMSIIFLVSVVAIPLAILIAGIVVWVQRRNRG